MVAGRPRVAPARCPDCRGPAHVRGASLPRAVPVRRAHRRPRHHPERQLPCPDRRRHGRLGLRVDAAGERLGVSRGALRRQPRRDDVARRRAAPAHRRVRRQRPSDRPVPRARARLPKAAADVARAQLPVPIPKLCTLVVASAFDAALHDAYGKAFGVSCYETYGAAFMRRDLSHDLGRPSRGSSSIATCRRRRGHGHRSSTRSAPATSSTPPT